VIPRSAHLIRAAALAILAFAPGLAAQQPPSGRSRLVVRVVEHARPIADAEVRARGKLALTDAEGKAVLELEPGAARIVVWRIGYAADTLRLTLPERGTTTLTVELHVVAMELAPIVVRSLRDTRRVEDVPERVEILAPEDVQEKTMTSPGTITNLLVEMGGVHVQSTSPGLGGGTIRVRGLPGRYTLLLSDGLPTYGSQPSSFSLVQLPPIDLRQVEVIKGTATALYGSSALGGVVNLISKRPTGQNRAVMDRTSEGGTDAISWLSRRWSEQWGYTAVVGVHDQSLRDLNGDGWGDLPAYTRVEARPRVFWNRRDGSSLMATLGGTWEHRKGGTVAGGVTPEGLPFEERADTRHADFGAVGRLVLRPGTALGVRTSVTESWRDRGFGGTTDHERRGTAFGEMTLSAMRLRHSLLFGVSGQLESFRSRPLLDFDYRFTSAAGFAADTYRPSDAIAITATARVDSHSRYGTFFSPRASALLHLLPGWSLRASAGTGFSSPPTAAGDEDAAGLRAFVPSGALRAERGTSASVDVDGMSGPLQFNATAFWARVRDPVVATPVVGDSTHLRLVNASGTIRTSGTDIFAVYSREPLLVTATYSHTRATGPMSESGRIRRLPLTPLNRGGVDVAFEEDESGVRLAVELYYTGRQRVADDPYRERTPGFVTLEILVSKRMERAEVFLDLENLTDVRQTGWDPLLLPAPGRGGRWTTDQWAPLEGRVARLGVQLSF
jgi:outer membrane receptor for ferrienterochelin and colicins